MASSDSEGAVLASTRDSPGAPAESRVERWTVRETRRVGDRVHTRKPPQRTQPKTDAGGTSQGQPHRGALNGYDAEGKGTTVSGQPTRALRATGPDEARRTDAGSRGTPERHAAGHNPGTGTGAKQQRPPGTANPGSAHDPQ